MAPLAQRDLTAEIDADALGVMRVWAPTIALDGQRQRTVVAWVDVEGRPAAAAWLASVDADGPGPDNEAEIEAGGQPEVRTDWIFLTAAPEAILIGVVGDGDRAGSFRFNIRFAADPYRRQLEALAETGRLGLTTVQLQLGPERQLESPCTFIEVQRGPLRTFLRDLPAPPVV